MITIGLIAALLFVGTLCLLAFRPDPPKHEARRPAAKKSAPAKPSRSPEAIVVPAPKNSERPPPEDPHRSDGPTPSGPELPADFRSHDIVRHLDERGYATLKDLYFHPGSPKLREDSTGELAVIAALLLDESESRFDIEGSSNGNAFLAKHRAEAVIQQLVGVYGVNPAQLRPRGRAAGTSNVARNRRVQIIRANA